jgi:Chromo (CHRromatin Organisation MOdifier) domain
VSEEITSREQATRLLKEQLIKAQARMKKYADFNRSERKFHEGDWVYLKLQPYRQVSVRGKLGNHKLQPKFFGPFEILERIGQVAYKLNLPPGTMIHPVFHVSQLKKRVGTSTAISTGLPIIGIEGEVWVEPVAILDRRLTKRNNKAVTELLIKWSNLEDEDATWEVYEDLVHHFPLNKLEDKLRVEEGILSTHELSKLETVGIRSNSSSIMKQADA